MQFRGKRKSNGVVLLIKQGGHVYMHVIFALTFFLFASFLFVSGKKFLCFLDNFYALESSMNLGLKAAAAAAG